MRTGEEGILDDSIDFDALRAVVREHQVQLAILFGSHVTGETHPASDVDVAVEFEGLRPADRGYNDAFFGLSADLSATLGTDAIDVVDVHTVSPAFAESIFEDGVLVVGDEEHAADLRRTLTADETGDPAPRDRLDAALSRIDAHLGRNESAVRMPGEPDDER